MSSPNVHSAAGLALGYYYQVVCALRLLLLDYEDATVSIESWGDVYLEKSDRRELHQLKHNLDTNKTIGIKSRGVWRTLTVFLNLDSFSRPLQYFRKIQSSNVYAPKAQIELSWSRH